MTEQAKGCEWCKQGYRLYYHDFCDGRGRARMHEYFNAEDNMMDSTFCQIDAKLWERHPVYFWGATGFVSLVALSGFMQWMGWN